MSAFADGLHPNLSRDRYDRIERVNFSTLKNMRLSPAHYRHALGEKFKDTDPKKLGRAIHLATLEPERIRSTIAVWDGGPRKGKEWDKFVDEHEGCELLTERENELCTAIASAVRGHRLAQPYLSNGRGEVTLLWTHKVGGYEVPCKGRIDFDAAGAIVDLKTTRDASPEGFGREVWKYRYHTQAAWYSDGYELAGGGRKPYVIVAVENTPPFIVQVYRVPEPLLALGREEYSAWMDRLALCRETATWPAYHDGELELTLPRWALPFDDDEDLSSLDIGSSGADLVTPA